MYRSSVTIQVVVRNKRFGKAFAPTTPDCKPRCPFATALPPQENH
jgi:hypothetical protein